MTEPMAGEFHATRTVNGWHEALPTWRVTTPDPGVADGLARLLGGTPRPIGAVGGGLEVVTDAESVRVMVERTGSGVGFRLKGSTGLGRFDFCPWPWTVPEITRLGSYDGAAGVGGRDTGAQLIIKRVEIQTHTGVYAAHLVPLLLLPAK
ncbi:hypothetical protein OG900_28815 [Streptomyces sp. NBC_00433]